MVQVNTGRLAHQALRLALALAFGVLVLVGAETDDGKSDVPADLKPYLPFQFSKVLSLQWWLQHLAAAYHEDPEHMVIEFICVAIIFYLLFRPTSQKPEALTEREKDKLVDEWDPEPLVPTDVHIRKRTAPRLVSATGPTMTVADESGKESKLLNFGSYNYLGLAQDPRLKQIAKDTIAKYSVGSCGPRGFYGTIDVHVDLEHKLREHFGTESAIIYTDWIGCINSVIPAFAKKHDLLVCDEGIHFLIQQGIRLSRANVLYFKHNDMDDLRQVLESIQEKDEQMSHKKLNRRFIITEGISHSYGDICPLDRIVALAKDFKYRVILDDSHAVGALHPKGSVGYHAGLQPEDVDILVGSLDTAIGSTGGFVVGSEEICYHQSLSSTGYVFTASAPPFQCTTATAALDIMREDASKGTFRRLHENARVMREQLDGVEGVDAGGSSSLWLDSPLIHVRLDDYRGRPDDAQALIDRIFETLQKPEGGSNMGVFALSQQYLHGLERTPEPSLKVCVTAQHTKEQITYAVQRIRAAVKEALAQGPGLR